MGPMIPSLAAFSIFFGILFLAPLLKAQNNWFQTGMLKEPAIAKALQSIDDRSSAIVDEWIRLVEIPAPSRKEQARAEYIRAEMQKLGLADVRMDDKLNVSGIRKGSIVPGIKSLVVLAVSLTTH
jgi:tripeptide aminopeptidase